MTPKQWNELKEGYGLEEVPKEFRQELACCMCGYFYPKGKLYTDRPIGSYTNVRELQAQIDKMRPNCYCRYHAESMFGTENAR